VKPLFRNISYSQSKDRLQVILRDDSFRPYFKREVKISDRKAMKSLMLDLKDKGVNFPADFI